MVGKAVSLLGGFRLLKVELGIIKSYGQWPPLESISPWQMRQVKRAAEIGLGARGSDEMEILTESLDRDPSFTPFMEKVRFLIS